MAAGPHEATWDGRDDAGKPVATGAYVCRLQTGGYRLMRKMVLMK